VPVYTESLKQFLMKMAARGFVVGLFTGAVGYFTIEDPSPIVLSAIPIALIIVAIDGANSTELARRVIRENDKSPPPNRAWPSLAEDGSRSLELAVFCGLCISVIIVTSAIGRREAVVCWNDIVRHVGKPPAWFLAFMTFGLYCLFIWGQYILNSLVIRHGGKRVLLGLRLTAAAFLFAPVLFDTLFETRHELRSILQLWALLSVIAALLKLFAACVAVYQAVQHGAFMRFGVPLAVCWLFVFAITVLSYWWFLDPADVPIAAIGLVAFLTIPFGGPLLAYVMPSPQTTEVASSAPRPVPAPDNSVAKVLSMDKVCDAFEEAWQKGKSPQVEEYLESHKHLDRQKLLRHLIDLEIDYLDKEGKQPKLSDYEARFPEAAEMLASIFGLATAPGTSDGALPSFEPPYRAKSIIGSGAFATVYEAKDDDLGDTVAIKVPHRKLIEEHGQRIADLFRDEARRMARLRHPGIVSVRLARPSKEHGCCIVMNFAGKSLDKILRERHGRAFPPEEASRIVAAVADAVEYAHDRQVVHRDLKPGNILLDEQWQPRVTDFGLALEFARLSLGKGEFAGTPEYMSPEQWRREVQDLDDGKCDVWALGVILYELLAGCRPFEGPRLEYQILHESPKPLQLPAAAASHELEAVCLRCFEKVAVQRPNARDLAGELRRLFPKA
jgi:tRNA A-37 threonylcarbamoyl transferase component Bud32